jgi:hypothetical protein
MKHIERHSPNFVNMKFNNYDNHVKAVDRSVYEAMDVHNSYNTQQKVRGTNHDREDLPTVNLASSVGPSGRVFLYASSKPRQIPSPPPVNLAPAKVDFYRTHGHDVKAKKMYDSNISEGLREQKKILKSKNYELDNRAWALKDYGCQPLMAHKLHERLQVENITLQSERGGPDTQLPSYKKNYTPISTF